MNIKEFEVLQNKPYKLTLMYELYEDSSFDKKAYKSMEDCELLAESKMSKDKFFYNISNQISLRKYMGLGLDKATVVYIIRRIMEAENYFNARGLNKKYLMYDVDLTLVDKENEELTFICVPAVNHGLLIKPMKAFIREILAGSVYDETEDLSYVGKILTYVNSHKELDTNELDNLLETILTEPSEQNDNIVPFAEAESVENKEEADDPNVEEIGMAGIVTGVAAAELAMGVEAAMDGAVSDLDTEAAEVEEQVEDQVEDVSDVAQEEIIEEDEENQPLEDQESMDQPVEEVDGSVEELVMDDAMAMNVAVHDQEDDDIEAALKMASASIVMPMDSVSEDAAAAIAAEEIEAAMAQEEAPAEVQEEVPVETEETPVEAVKEEPVEEPVVAPVEPVVPTYNIPIKKYPYLVRAKTQEKISITTDEFKIGKIEGMAEFILKDNPAVSRMHAIIQKKDGSYYICDNYSTNHTYLNGERLEPGKDYLLINGVSVRFANEEFTYIFEE